MSQLKFFFILVTCLFDFVSKEEIIYCSLLIVKGSNECFFFIVVRRMLLHDHKQSGTLIKWKPMDQTQNVIQLRRQLVIPLVL